jgi:hypothetical protein
VDGGKNAWKYVPILSANDRQRYTQLLNSSATYNDDEILELKKKSQLLKPEKSTLIGQAKELLPIRQAESRLYLEIKERDRQLTLLRNDFQLLQHKNITFHQQLKKNNSKTTSLQKENQELKLKINTLEYQ